MRLALVPGRWPGALLAVVGLLLALPSLIWPVLVVRFAFTNDGSSTVVSSGQGIWSWGKYAQLGDEGPGVASGVASTVGLGWLWVSLAVGAGGVAAWALLPRERGRALGICGTSFVAAGQVASSAQWAGQRRNGFFGEEDAVNVIEQQLTGWLQLASAVVLLAAVGFMTWRPVWAWLVPRWRGRGAGGDVVASERPPDPAEPPPLGAAVLRVPCDPERSRPSNDRRSVGFSDEEGDTGRRSRGLD